MPIRKMTLDPKNLPQMSAEEKAHYDALADDDIDYTDAPDLTDDEFARLDVREPGQPKEVVTMRIDAATVDFFKGSDPKGYTRRMAEVLRAYARSKSSSKGPVEKSPA